MNYPQQKFMNLYKKYGLGYTRVNNLCVFRNDKNANCVYIEQKDLIEVLRIL